MSGLGPKVGQAQCYGSCRCCSFRNRRIAIVGDGLSAIAGQRHAAPVLVHLVPRLQARRFPIGPICVVRQAHVAIQDEIGSLLKARVAVILIGERPGLDAVDSLGAYLVYKPLIGNTDAQRNCISNIRTGSLEPTFAAEALAWLIEQSLNRQLSGVHLKDDRRLAGPFHATTELR